MPLRDYTFRGFDPYFLPESEQVREGHPRWIPPDAAEPGPDVQAVTIAPMNPKYYRWERDAEGRGWWSAGLLVRYPSCFPWEDTGLDHGTRKRYGRADVTHLYPRRPSSS